jgi:hypothetical protein
MGSKVQAKFTLYRPWMPEGEKYSSALALTTAPERGVCRFATRKRPGISRIGGWMGQRSGLDGCETSSTPGFHAQTVQAIACCYTNCAIPAHRNGWCAINLNRLAGM